MNLLNLPRNNTKKNPNWMILTLSIVLLITIQIIPLFSTHNPIFPDSREYLSLSKSLYATGAYTFTTDSLLFNDKSVKEPHMRCRQPLYPLYLLLTYWIPGKHIILPIIGQIAMNIATFFLIYSIGKKIFGKSFWLGTPLLLLFPIPFWMCSTYVLTEPLYIFIHTVVLFLFLKFMRNPAPRLLDSILLGASIGAMILTRPTGLLFSFFIVLYATVRCINRKRHFIQLAIICCAIASTLLPWTLRNYFVLDDLTFLSSEGPVNLWLGSLKNDANWYNNPQFKAAVGDHYYISTVPQQKFMDFAFSNIKSNFPGYLMLGVRRIVFKWCRYSDFHVPIFFHLAQCTILILAAIGFSRHAREDIAQILLPVAAITIGMFFLHAESRFTWPVILIVLLFSGQGIRFLMGRFSMNPIRA